MLGTYTIFKLINSTCRVNINLRKTSLSISEESFYFIATASYRNRNFPLDVFFFSFFYFCEKGSFVIRFSTFCNRPRISESTEKTVTKLSSY